MFSSIDEKYLLRVLSRNDAVLFTGAGFSTDATNQLGQPLPLSSGLARQLWHLVGYQEAYEPTPLAEIYEVALQEGVKHDELRRFLESHLLVESVPAYYDALVRVYWYRIYTTNIDDLIPTVYHRKGEAHLDVLAYPRSDLKDRDVSLERIQALYLNGALPCNPTDITLSTSQYARRSGDHCPLYDQFVRDYATKPTIFIGTELNEPIIWQHVEARGRRGFRMREHRPKSFLIAPRIARPKRSTLKRLNIVPIEGTARQFLEWLTANAAHLPDRTSVWRVTIPSVVDYIAKTTSPNSITRDQHAFAAAFHSVPTAATATPTRSFYLLGASPGWDDLHENLDAPRAITQDILREVECALEPTVPEVARVIVILGSAGSGKSTILRRLGVILNQTGHTVFHSDSEALPKPEAVRSAVSMLASRCVLLLDNSEAALSRVAGMVAETSDLVHPPVFVLTARTNDYEQRSTGLVSATQVQEWRVPDLSREEIIEVIARLEGSNLLGRLRGMSMQDRIGEFEQRAGKQLLVAMREATSGQGFDEIIKSEFDGLPSIESKYLYLCTALATDAGYRLGMDQFVGCTTLPPTAALEVLDRNLTGIVLRKGAKRDLLSLRHRLIATFVLDTVAGRELVGTAYRRLLRVVAPGTRGVRRESRTFRLYRELLSHRKVYHRFASNVEEARSIYDSIGGRFATSFDYWLQYGLLELEFGFLELAENYLRQSESMYPKSDYVQNAIGHLTLKKGIEAGDRTAAMQLRAEGSAQLREQMRTGNSPYPYHIYATQRRRWMEKWIGDKAGRREEIEHLQAVVDRGRKRFGRNSRLRALGGELRREYLWLAVEGDGSRVGK